MIDRIDTATVEELAHRTGGPWITIELPTEKVGPDHPTRLRYRQLLAQAVDLLEDRSVASDVVDDIARQGATLLDRQDLWRHRERALVTHVAPHDVVAHRLADSCEESVKVSEQPDVELLRTALANDRRYGLLALSSADVRWLTGDRGGLHEVDPSPLPRSMDEALSHIDRESQLQSHSSGRAGAGSVIASFHGQGSNQQADVDQFLRAVDRALANVIDPHLPVVLAGVDRIVAAFRGVSRHQALSERSISGNVSHLAPVKLHDRAWPIVNEAGEDASSA